MKLFILLVILCIAVNKYQAYDSVPNFNQVIELQSKLTKLVKDLWNKVQDMSWCEVTTTVSQGPDVCTAKVFYEFDNELRAAYESKIARSWLFIDIIWPKCHKEMRQINSLYENFAAFIKIQAQRRYSSSHEDWMDLTEEILHNSTEVLKSIRSMIRNQFDRMDLGVSDSDLCEFQQSKHLRTIDKYLPIFEYLMITEIKSFAMKNFSWMILFLHRKGNIQIEKVHIDKYELKDIIVSTLDFFNNQLKKISRTIWKCDPNRHIEGETYVQITRLLQGYIENEVDMNKEGTCRENCAIYEDARNYGCFKEQFCSRQRSCQGRLHSCRYIDSDMTICLAPRHSNRQYEWVEYDNGVVYGKKKTCRYGMSKVQSWWRWLFWHCSYCLCICDQNEHNSDRFFSLSEVKSNIKENKVITGLRFNKINRIIYLEISQGVLLPTGLIDFYTNVWLPTKPKELNEVRVDVDYVRLSYDERGINLDDMDGPQDNVLTGVRLRKVNGRLNFEIQTTPFNYATGKLEINSTKWITNNVYRVARKRLDLTKPGISTHSLEASKIDSTTNQYINFVHTDLNADFAQTTVPFIDIQPVTSIKLVPLTGAGIYHKGHINFGGFIAPKIFTFDYLAQNRI